MTTTLDATDRPTAVEDRLTLAEPLAGYARGIDRGDDDQRVPRLYGPEGVA